jgi:hypothetical protein
LNAYAIEVFDVNAVFAHSRAAFLVNMREPAPLGTAQVYDFEANARSAFAYFAAYDAADLVAAFFQRINSFHQNRCFSDAWIPSQKQHTLQQIIHTH